MALDAVAILGGTGQQGSGLARRLAAAGVRVIVGSRDPRRARSTFPDASSSHAIEVADNASAASSAGTVVLAVPFGTVDALLDDIAPRLRSDAVVIDLTVPLSFAGGKLTMLDVAEGSAAEHIRTRLPSSVALACLLKTVPAHRLDRADVPLECDDFVCGDSDAARARAAELGSCLAGLRVVDVGPLWRARSIEHLTALAVAINRRYHILDARFRVIGL
ncbi:MAG TPA: NADPH-dependent F420 reductase [Vicinamibacterales bacterium]|nr:NADPH-dependent F420 reductase [Vicinamibacterales bacterium]